MADNSDVLAIMATMHKLLKEQGQDPHKCKITITHISDEEENTTTTSTNDFEQLGQYDNEELLKYVVNTKIEKDEQKPKESLIKEIDENEDIPPMPDNWPWDYPRWKDYCKRNNKRIPPTDPKVETGYITRDEENDVGYLHYPDGSMQTFKIRDATGNKKTIEESPLHAAILKKQKEAAIINELKDLANECGKEDPRIKKEKEDNQPVDVEKLLSALEKITNKLLDLEYYNAIIIINELISYITDDPRIIRGTHLKKDSIDKLIHDIDNLISDAEDYLDANELMVLYFGIYLARIKNKEIRNKGVRNVVNTILHPPVQDLI